MPIPASQLLIDTSFPCGGQELIKQVLVFHVGKKVQSWSTIKLTKIDYLYKLNYIQIIIESTYSEAIEEQLPTAKEAKNGIGFKLTIP